MERISELTSYIERKQAYSNASYTINPNGIFYFVNGELVPEVEWKQHNKPPIYIKRNLSKGQNPDRTHDWLYE